MNYILQILPSLLSGVQMTLTVFVVTLVISIPLGFIISLGLRAKFKPLNGLLTIYVWLMRGTPLLLQLIFVFYGLPIVGLVFDRLPAALIAFVLNYAAYFAEIFRGGFNSINQGQYEAAQMLRLTKWQTLQKIIIPQVNKQVIPAIGNEVINLIKDSSLVYVIGLGDLLRAGNIAMARDVTLLPLVVVGIVYLVLIGVLTWGLKRVEKHYSYYR